MAVLKRILSLKQLRQKSLKKLIASSLMETIVATILIVLIFTLTIATIDRVFLNTKKTNTVALETAIEQFIYKNRSVRIIDQNDFDTEKWHVEIRKKNINNIFFYEIKAVQKDTKQLVVKKVIINER